MDYSLGAEGALGRGISTGGGEMHQLGWYQGGRSVGCQREFGGKTVMAFRWIQPVKMTADLVLSEIVVPALS